MSDDAARDIKKFGAMAWDAFWNGNLPEKITISREKVPETEVEAEPLPRCRRCKGPMEWQDDVLVCAKTKEGGRCSG